MAKHVVNPNRVYEDYDPRCDLVTEEGCDTIRIYLLGYKKEQLKIQLTTSRILRISGEQQIGYKCRRFWKEFRVPPNCDTKEITAKFEGGILYITQPKLITPVRAPEQPAGKGKAEAEAPKTPQQQQPQPEVPLRGPQKGMKEEMGRKDNKEERGAISKKGEEGKDKCEFKERTMQMGGGGGLFSEMRKPENFKRLAISVLLVISIGFYATYMFK